MAAQVIERQPTIDDVFDDQNVPTGDVGVQVFQQPHDTARLGTLAVARDSDEVDRHWHGDRARQVDHEHDAALEDAHEQQIAQRSVVVRDLLADLAHLRLNVVGRNQDFRDVVVHVSASGVRKPRRGTRRNTIVPS